MRPVRAGAVLLAVQMLLVLSVAGKYLYERETRPRLWTRAVAADPDAPLRGRYMAMQVVVDACSLPHDPERLRPGYKDANGKRTDGEWVWQVTLQARDGRLVPVLQPQRADGVAEVSLREHADCGRATVQRPLEYFVPEHATLPLPLKPGEELWVEVTVPVEGPPRPVQLAVSRAGHFAVLHL